MAGGKEARGWQLPEHHHYYPWLPAVAAAALLPSGLTQTPPEAQEDGERSGRIPALSRFKARRPGPAWFHSGQEPPSPPSSSPQQHPNPQRLPRRGKRRLSQGPRPSPLGCASPPPSPFASRQCEGILGCLQRRVSPFGRGFFESERASVRACSGKSLLSNSAFLEKLRRRLVKRGRQSPAFNPCRGGAQRGSAVPGKEGGGGAGEANASTTSPPQFGYIWRGLRREPSRWLLSGCWPSPYSIPFERNSSPE
ncbi:uncharacterized protein LOC103283054 [Anolis carolinensis]|uniref:uncharacterized protein LOC103283054 n=1 Tax=Anolis carolinensis TaxID=28377 RepID=UPI000462A944|nr:PREDICTED: uncharacterized protein LOC103283054 [Anolis carolinensis]|eukprot:XP_016846973.1 PREDICTED: uncharacterized protein LOC103283054 [Anolis carolinensis]